MASLIIVNFDIWIVAIGFELKACKNNFQIMSLRSMC